MIILKGKRSIPERNQHVSIPGTLKGGQHAWLFFFRGNLAGPIPGVRVSKEKLWDMRSEKHFRSSPWDSVLRIFDEIL